MYELSTALPIDLKFLRLTCNLTQQQVASMLHISRQCYGAYERGERTMPSELLKVCSRLYRIPAVPTLLPDTELLTQEEQDLLSCFRRLDTDGREQILSMIHYEVNPEARYECATDSLGSGSYSRFRAHTSL